MESCKTLDKILEGILDRSPYTMLTYQQLWEDAKEELFQELLDAGTINIKTIVAFDVIRMRDYYGEVNPRKLKRCYRYFRKHRIDYDDLFEMVNRRRNMLEKDNATIKDIFMNMLLGGI